MIAAVARNAKKQIETHDDVAINFLGVWDTVGALGIPVGILGEITGAIHGYVAEKIMRLENIASQILAAHVVLVHDESTATGNSCVKVHVATSPKQSRR